MKIYSKSLLLLTVLIIILICLPALVHAQGSPTDPGCDVLDPACPIDGGLGLLLAAGVGYGIKKIRDTRKKQISTPQL